MKKQTTFIENTISFFNAWFGSWFISKEMALKAPLDDVMLHSGNCCDIQIALQTDHFANLAFQGSNWESNWTVAERLLASYEEAVRECKLILLKAQWTFFNISFQNLFICKKNSVIVFLINTDGTQKTLQTVRWLCEPVILSIGHFEGPTEFQLKSWWKAASVWTRISKWMQVNFT